MLCRRTQIPTAFFLISFFCSCYVSSAETKQLILSRLEEQAEANLGTAMMYTLFEWAKENQESLMENHKAVVTAVVGTFHRIFAWLLCLCHRVFFLFVFFQIPGHWLWIVGYRHVYLLIYMEYMWEGAGHDKPFACSCPYSDASSVFSTLKVLR